MDWPALLAWRMRRQQLAERAPAEEALAVVSRIAGLHAQVMASADAALRARVDGLPDDFLPAALWRDGTLVKTWAMRGTLHLLVREELPTFAGALSRPRPRHHQPAWQRAYGVTREQADAMLAAIPTVLARKPLTRAELASELARRTNMPELEEKLADGFGALLKPAAFAGDLVFAEGEGQRVRFTTPDVTPEDGEEAAHRVVRTYLAAYGPAPREQFQRWFGLQSPAEAGRWLQALGNELEEVEQGWMLAADAEEAAAEEPAGAVRLLPAFDPYVVAAPRKEEAVLAAARRAEVYRPQGWLSPVLLVDGVIRGVWRREKDAIDLTPFGRLAAAERAAATGEAERLGSSLTVRRSGSRGG
jgi:hypothetical protein